mmetsp:Transcript_40736/g.93708  ORF Transcript_40736/g.93708 Transcript_40736/m.93708 type:complete len:254 (-) Transcript_40736:225-986(-)
MIIPLIDVCEREARWVEFLLKDLVHQLTKLLARLTLFDHALQQVGAVHLCVLASVLLLLLKDPFLFCFVNLVLRCRLAHLMIHLLLLLVHVPDHDLIRCDFVPFEILHLHLLLVGTFEHGLGVLFDLFYQLLPHVLLLFGLGVMEALLQVLALLIGSRDLCLIPCDQPILDSLLLHQLLALFVLLYPPLALLFSLLPTIPHNFVFLGFAEVVVHLVLLRLRPLFVEPLLEILFVDLPLTLLLDLLLNHHLFNG